MSTGSNETASVVNAYESKKANKEAMNQQNMWNAASMAEQQKQFNLNRADLAPYSKAGADSLAEIQALMGNSPTETRFYSDAEKLRKAAIEKELARYGALTGAQGGKGGKDIMGALKGSNQYAFAGPLGSVYGGLTGSKGKGNQGLANIAMYSQYKSDALRKELAGLGRDYTPEELAQQKAAAQAQAFSRFRADPGYQFSVDQGRKTIEGGAAGKGGLYSGRTLMALNDYGQGMADQQYGNYYNRLWNTANMGRGTAVGIADMGTGYANSMSNLYNQRGQIGSARAYGDAAAMGNMASTIGANQQEGFNTAINTASSLYGGYSGMKK